MLLQKAEVSANSFVSAFSETVAEIREAVSSSDNWSDDFTQPGASTLLKWVALPLVSWGRCTDAFYHGSCMDNDCFWMLHGSGWHYQLSQVLAEKTQRVCPCISDIFSSFLGPQMIEVVLHDSNNRDARTKVSQSWITLSPWSYELPRDHCCSAHSAWWAYLREQIWLCFLSATQTKSPLLQVASHLRESRQSSMLCREILGFTCKTLRQWPWFRLVCVCVSTSVSKRLFFDFILFSTYSRGAQEDHRAVPNEALYGILRKTYLQVGTTWMLRHSWCVLSCLL